MQHTVAIPNGYMRLSSTDAVFRTLSGDPIAMEFSRFCGPMFTLDHGADGFTYMPEEGSDEWNHLWRQFDGWFKAKGKKLN